MEIAGSYSLNAPREQAWSALLDPDIIKRALPGCESLARTSDNTYTMRLNVDVAQVRGAYDGVARVLEAQQPESFRMVVDATGTRGIFHGDGVVRLEAQDAGTTVVRYSGQAQLGGAIASMGAQVARGAANILLKQYFARLVNLLPATPVAATATETPMAATPVMPLTPASPFTPEAETLIAPTTPPAAAPVDALMPSPTAPIVPAAPPPTAPAAPPESPPASAPTAFAATDPSAPPATPTADATPVPSAKKVTRQPEMAAVGSERRSARFLGVVIAIVAVVVVALVVWLVVGNMR